MNITSILRLAFTLLFFLSVSNLASQENKKDTLCPLEVIKKAVELDSIELLKTAYSKRMQGVISSDKEWEKGFEYWKTQELDNFTCEINPKTYRAIFFYKGQKKGSVKVIEEESVWKLDEK